MLARLDRASPATISDALLALRSSEFDKLGRLQLGGWCRISLPTRHAFGVGHAGGDSCFKAKALIASSLLPWGVSRCDLSHSVASFFCSLADTLDPI